MLATLKDCVSPGLRRSLTVLALLLTLARWSLDDLSVWGQAPAEPKAEVPPQIDGLFVTVKNPITSTVVSRIKNKVDRFLQRPDHRGLKIVFDFNPEGYPSSTPDYDICASLTRAILELHDVTTIAFIHNDVTGHTVLPVLACREIVMSKGGKPTRNGGFSAEAKLGDALREQNRGLDDDQKLFYTKVAQRTGRCPALILKMADKNMEVVEGTRDRAVWYADRNRLDEEKKLGFVPSQPLQVVVEAGKAGLYTTAQATKFGLVGLQKETRAEVAVAYSLPTRSLREDPLEGRPAVASRIVITGPVNSALYETITRRMRRAIANRGVNVFVLQLECGGGGGDLNLGQAGGEGPTSAARALADFFRTLKDDAGNEPVMTIAYVTQEARDTATFLAFGCSEIVMSKHAGLGDFERLVREHPKYQDAISKSLEDLAREQGYDPLLARGFLDPALDIHRVRTLKSPIEKLLVENEQLVRDKKGEPKWIDEGQIKAPGEWLRLDAERARELGVAREYFEGIPAEALPKVYKLFGLEHVRDASLDWLDEVAAFLRLGWVGALLIIVGIMGLILELKLPGVGLPGVLAAIAFVLYFWAHSQMHGNMTMLAVLLFVLGLALIGLEIFVVPGFGVTGISGIALIVVSLALATLVKKPETTQEWLEFGTTLSQIAVSLVAAVVSSFVLAWYLPYIPYVNRMVLAPPMERGEAGEEEASLAMAATLSLLGAIGEAATDLRPAGKARFGDEYIDVIAEGSYVHAGTRVQVIEIESNRIVVKEV